MVGATALAAAGGVNRDPGRGGAQPTGGVLGPPAGLETPGAPALALQPDVVPGSGEELRVDGVVATERAPQVGALLEPPMPLAGEGGGPARRARRRGDVGVVEEDALPGQLIERGVRTTGSPSAPAWGHPQSSAMATRMLGRSSSEAAAPAVGARPVQPADRTRRTTAPSVRAIGLTVGTSSRAAAGWRTSARPRGVGRARVRSSPSIPASDHIRHVRVWMPMSNA